MKWWSRPGSRVQEGKMGANTNILNGGKKHFQHSKNFKLLSRIYGNAINVFFFFAFIISVRDGHCDYLPQATNDLDTSLHTRIPYRQLITQ